MSVGEPLPVTLELRLEDGVVRGTMLAGHAAPAEFSGWLGLLSLLETLLAPAHDEEPRAP